MSLKIKDYYVAKTIDECLEILQSHEGRARVIAGGTDLVLDLKNKKKETDVLVDITRIAALRELHYDDPYVYVGAAVTHAEIAKSPIIQKYAPLLSKACGMMGSPQIRNIATIGGNIVNAMPAADGALALCTMGAEVQIWSKREARWEKIEDLYLGVGRSKVNPTNELVTKIRFRPLGGKTGFSYQRLARRKALSLPIVNVAAIVQLDPLCTTFERVSIFIAPVSPVPLRARELENKLCGMAASETSIKQASAIVREIVNPRDSLRGSAAYKREMAKVLVQRALTEALRVAKNRCKDEKPRNITTRHS